MEISVGGVATPVSVEKLTGPGGTKGTRCTAVSLQETISVLKIEMRTLLTAPQVFYSPGTNHAMVPVLAVQ